MVSLVTPHTDMDPSPRVVVDIDDSDLDVATSTITVWQISAAGEFRCRGMINQPSAGGFIETDYEVPVGVPVSYRVEQFNASGTSLGFVLNMSTQVDIADGVAVFSDPLSPTRAVLVEAHVDFGGQLVKQRPTRLYRAGGETIALSGQQGMYEEVPLRCQTQTIADADLLDEILSETQVLIRLMPSGGRLPGVFHAVIPAPTQVPMDVQYGGEWIRWELSGTQVSRTEVDVLVPVYPYSLYAAAFATYGNAALTYSTYLDARRNPPSEA